MNREKLGIFAEWAPLYRSRGFCPRPIGPGTKACKLKGWQRPDRDIAQSELARWLTDYPHHGIGLLMGSPFPDDTRLGALDVDRDEYVRIAAALLGDPPSGRIGRKGIAYFVRVAGKLGNPKFRVKGKDGETWGQVAECLFDRALCVIPPTIHPDTGTAYRWIGKPLLDVDWKDLPIIGDPT